MRQASVVVVSIVVIGNLSYFFNAQFAFEVRKSKRRGKPADPAEDHWEGAE